MKGFYDDILPRFMDKYGKKWGVKTEDIELPELEEAAQTMRAVPVTAEMKKSVMEGQLMFSRNNGNRAAFTPDGRSKEVKQEIDQILAAAYVNGTIGLAPNGKKSNLPEDLWGLVRTKAFKKWFGDWEKPSRIEKLRKSKNASITGNEIVLSSDDKANKKAALEYAKTLQGYYTNADTGMTIQPVACLRVPMGF